MRGRLTAPVLALALLAAGPVPARAAEPVVDCVEVATRAPNNPRVKVWYRAPRRYDGFERTYWTDNVLRVAYFGSDLCYEDRLVDLIEVRADDCGDGYDGLFIACWFMNSPRTDAALAERFADWFKNGTLDRGGCSMADVFRLICKWEREERGAACGGVRRLYHDYVQRRCDVAHFRANGLW